MKDIFKGTSTSTSTIPKALTVDDINRVIDFISEKPPSIRVQYSEYIDPNAVIEIDVRKMEQLKNLFILPFNFVEMADIWYIIGKNRIEDFLNEGIHVYGIKKDG